MLLHIHRGVGGQLHSDPCKLRCFHLCCRRPLVNANSCLFIEDSSRLEDGVYRYCLLYTFAQVAFRQLLDVFFDKVDPTTLNRQGGDRGTQYRSGIYFHDEEQRLEAQQKIAEVNEQLAKVTWVGGHGLRGLHWFVVV